MSDRTLLNAHDLAQAIADQVAHADSHLNAFVVLLAVYTSLADLAPSYQAFAAQMLQDKGRELAARCAPCGATHPNQTALFH